MRGCPINKSEGSGGKDEGWLIKSEGLRGKGKESVLMRESVLKFAKVCEGIMRERTLMRGQLIKREGLVKG